MVDGGDEVIRVPEAARLLGVHETGVYRLIKAGRLPAVTERGRWLIHRRDVDELIAASRIRPRQP